MSILSRQKILGNYPTCHVKWVRWVGVTVILRPHYWQFFSCIHSKGEWQVFKPSILLVLSVIYMKPCRSGILTHILSSHLTYIPFSTCWAFEDVAPAMYEQLWLLTEHSVQPRILWQTYEVNFADPPETWQLSELRKHSFQSHKNNSCQNALEKKSSQYTDIKTMIRP